MRVEPLSKYQETDSDSAASFGDGGVTVFTKPRAETDSANSTAELRPARRNLLPLSRDGVVK